jgi:hypothetical protein
MWRPRRSPRPAQRQRLAMQRKAGLMQTWRAAGRTNGRPGARRPGCPRAVAALARGKRAYGRARGAAVDRRKVVKARADQRVTARRP